jgi:hypothetical protein
MYMIKLFYAAASFPRLLSICIATSLSYQHDLSMFLTIGCVVYVASGEGMSELRQLFIGSDHHLLAKISESLAADGLKQMI